MDPITLPSPAKVNLYLKILGRRPDGFHELETIMAALSLGDEMRFEPRAHGVTVECDAPGVPTDASNLAVRAAEMLQKKSGSRQGVHIIIRKRTPVGGGMGGGSSNAATSLLALNRLWNLDVSTAELEALAAALGSDCAFFLRPPVALCRGRGEIIEPVPADHCRALAGPGLVLVNPGFGVSTPWAYKAYAARGGAGAEPGKVVQPMLEAIDHGDARQIAAQLYNSLEAPVFHKYPLLGIFKQSLLDAGACGAMLSGSGATVFGLCETVAAAEAVQAKIAAKFGAGLWTHVARFAA